MGMLSSLPYLLSIFSLWGCGTIADKIGRRAPFMTIGFLVTAISVYCGAYVSNNMTSAILLSIGVAGVAISLSGAHSILQSIVPRDSVGTATGVMNGIANGVSALSPLLMGYLISVTGSYNGGLMFLVGAAVVGCISMLGLSIQKF